MTKLSQAIETLSNAKQAVTWDTSGECIVVTTHFFEADGTPAGSIERHFLNDNPPPEPVDTQTIGADDVGEVSADLIGESATVKGATL